MSNDPGAERLRARAAIAGGALLTLAVLPTAPWAALGLVPALAIAVTLEVATTRQWGGFWGEKNPDGTPRH